jgi:NAD(P)-dependent dehydrogenase (short-subunit alcohol dehydrogenase family)
LQAVHQGKIALVTGSSRGIGKAIALKLAADGADVAVCARSERSTELLPGSIGETASAIQALGRRALAIRVDVTNDDDVRSMVDDVMREFGRVDILVNNAALAGLAGPGRPYLEGDASLIDMFYRTNVRAPFVISRLIGAHMATADGGVIVNISSGMGRLPQRAAGSRRAGVHMGYAISKAALDRFGAAIAAELWGHRIAVITVYPGLTLIERVAGRTDINLSGAESPNVTANAVSFLCQDSMAHSGTFVIARDVAPAEGTAPRRPRP